MEQPPPGRGPAPPRPAARTVWRTPVLSLLGMLAVACAAIALDGDMRQALHQRLAASWAGARLAGAADKHADRHTESSAHSASDAAAAAQSPWDAAYFPNPVLTDQHGRRWRFYDDLVKGKAVAVNTFFTVCSDICPLGTAKMRELQTLLGARMGRDVFFYSISVDPMRDSPEALREYAERYGIGPGWLLLTGKDEDVRQISRKLGLGRLQQTDARESHSATLTIGHAPSGRWMKSASTDNPRYLAAHMATFLGWPADEVAGVRQAEARPLKISTGEFLFRNACASCHHIGGGPGIGPDLLGVDQRRPTEWLQRFIRQPDALLNAGDPVAAQLLAQYKGVRMPNLGLTAGEVDEVLGYIQARSALVRQRPAATPSTAAR